jgi:acetamidase/formamidase
MKISVIVLAVALAAQTRGAQTHRLEVTPSTVAYGYYWSEAKPVLRIASGDINDVDTMLTSNPMALARAGVPDNKIQDSLKAVVSEVTGDRRGPGGHILTGPVYVEGAAPGDALEVKVLSIDFPIDYGYNGCNGFIPENCDRNVPMKIVPLDKTKMTAEFFPGIVIPLRPFFGSMGVAPAPELGRVSSNPPGKHAGNLDNKELAVDRRCDSRFRSRRAVRNRRWHAAQGDGEVDQTAIETSLRGRVQLTVARMKRHGRAPGRHPTTSVRQPIRPNCRNANGHQEMVDFLAESKHLTKHEAYQLVSVAGNVANTARRQAECWSSRQDAEEYFYRQ